MSDLEKGILLVQVEDQIHNSGYHLTFTRVKDGILTRMKAINETSSTGFILIGFSVSNETSLCLFVLITVVYAVTITSNIVIIAIVKTEQRLHKPMYFFIGGLAFLEIWYPSATVPRLLWALLTKEKSISHGACMAQFYFHFACGATENFLLAVMAYDRYVAICHPLRYVLILSPRICMNLLVGSWLFGFIVIIIPCLQISNLLYCGHNEIDHYYCDFAPLLKLSCSEISATENAFFGIACFVIFGCFLPIILSYIFIIRTILTFPASGRRRAFSTCASHLIVVFIFYSTIIFMFIRPTTGDFLHVNKVISIFPSIVTPLLNPIIYTLRNQEVKSVVKKTIQGITFWKSEEGNVCSKF
ncbi:olfactory receptor 6F1-like [Spea bombifrons]|uniref:olfactory receptor 6F1-like n=1 Tax=Spea bombifrons TaxID=233779 RepID=UPI00234AF567|nr:olfactory receptor 6F1-like [Spea bombifrons]